MESRNPGRLVEQLQNAQFRQRKVIQQLQADNTRLLSDLVEIRQERDAFREEAARVRRENAELRNRLEEVLTRCQDLKRERATFVHFTNVNSGHLRGARITNVDTKIPTTLPVLNEGQGESSPTTESTVVDVTMETSVSPKLRPHMYRELPNLPNLPKQASPT